MANLSQLIDARRTLEAQGISIANDVDKQIKKEEDRLIQEELYRAMRNALRDTLSVLDQPITFTLHYDPANPSTYTIEHRRTGELSSEEEAAQREAREARRLKRKASALEQALSSSSITRLRIVYADGTSLEEKSAADTFRAFVQKSGVAQVRDLGLKLNKEPLIIESDGKELASSFKHLEKNYYLQTGSPTGIKQKFIQRIIDGLGIDAHIEIVPIVKPAKKERARRRKK
ncbi:hypothetical protein [uncultured Porphyromonas sp.]|uniref:hypothetical protein n=1 Tax=uncultured Porphyromonas sp. TaxID=159274 RepID=UPI00261738D7|nr:hypothetical protein [uncultured Porphyromonas sp.]